MSTNQNTKPYGAASMQDVTEEMSASKLSCVSGAKLVDMMCHEGRSMETETQASVENLY